MNWDRDRRFDDTRRKESYRPVDRPRSPFRNRTPPRQAADTWVPSDGRSSGRPRTRSPANLRRSSRSPGPRDRDAGAGFSRGRTPPRRVSPRRERQWSPSRPRRSRSPYGQTAIRSPRPSRTRSPPPKRTREPSTGAYSTRSPKRERVTSPPRGKYDRFHSPPSGPRQRTYGSHRGGFYPPSRVPARRDPPKDSYENSWRPQSPTNGRSTRYERDSGHAPTDIQRRPSPPTRPLRHEAIGSVSGFRSPPKAPARQHESPARSTTSDLKSLAQSSDHHPYHPTPSESTQRGHMFHQSPPGRRAMSPNQSPRNRSVLPHDHPQQQPVQRNTSGNPPTRPVPSSPPGRPSKPASAMPPAGPSAAPISAPAANRAANLSLLSAPTRPRGGSSFKRDTPREPPAQNLSRRGPPSCHNNPPAGPRSSFSPAAVSHDQHRPRHNSGNLAAQTRTSRLTNHLSGGPTLVPGGKLLASGLDPTLEKRLAQLEMDKEKLLEQVAEKQKVKRTRLREWDRLERESAISALRSELADGHLQRMVDGDSIGGGVAF